MRMGFVTGFGVDGIGGDYLYQPGGTFMDIGAPDTGGGSSSGVTHKNPERPRSLVEKPIRVRFGDTEEPLDLDRFYTKFGVSPAAILRYHQDPEDRGSDGGVARAIINQSIGRGFDRSHIAAVAAQADVINAHVTIRCQIAALSPKEALEILCGAARQKTPISESYFHDLLNGIFGSGDRLITTACYAFFEAHREITPDGIGYLSCENITRFLVAKVLPMALEKTGSQYNNATLELYTENRLSPAELGRIEREAAASPYLMARIVTITTRAVQSLPVAPVTDFQIPERLVYVYEKTEADKIANAHLQAFVNGLNSSQALDILLSGKTTLSLSIFMKLVQTVLKRHTHENLDAHVGSFFNLHVPPSGRNRVIDGAKVAKFARGELHTFAQTRRYSHEDSMLELYLDGKMRSENATTFERNMASDGLLDLRVRVMREQRQK